VKDNLKDTSTPVCKRVGLHVKAKGPSCKIDIDGQPARLMGTDLMPRPTQTWQRGCGMFPPWNWHTEVVKAFNNFQGSTDKNHLEECP
jgi:hypothetical protein